MLTDLIDSKYRSLRQEVRTKSLWDMFVAFIYLCILFHTQSTTRSITLDDCFLRSYQYLGMKIAGESHACRDSNPQPPEPEFCVQPLHHGVSFFKSKCQMKMKMI